MKHRIDSRAEDVQRLAILKASKDRDVSYVPHLIHLLSDPDTCLNNRRHIVRALGHIGHQSAEAPLLHILVSESDLIVGDAAQALGRLGAVSALSSLHRVYAACDPSSLERVRSAINWLTGAAPAPRRRRSHHSKGRAPSAARAPEA